MTQHATEIKACCAAAYDQDIVALILGDSYHPGGLTLTRRLAELAGLGDGQRLLDVASGPGASALALAREHAISVDGVDLGEKSIQRARRTAANAGVDDRVRFHRGDAESLPFDDASFDVVLSECAFCTFPDKPTAAAEFARVLTPGGRVALADVTVRRPGGLPTELHELAGWIACLADARPAERYAELLTDVGLTLTAIEAHHDALARMVAQIDARLRVLRMSAIAEGVDLDGALRMTRQAAAAVADGALGYALLVAEKP